MNAVKRPSAVDGLRRGVGTPQVRSDDSIGRQEDIGRLSPPQPVKPVRFTLDLEPELHQFLKVFAAETGRKVGGAQVLRALLGELQADPDLAARVRARIWQGQSGG